MREPLAPELGAVLGGSPPMSVEWAGMGEMMYAAFPDGRHTIDETFEIGDRVSCAGASQARTQATSWGRRGRDIHVK
jgi:predicted ester cyclase